MKTKDHETEFKHIKTGKSLIKEKEIEPYIEKIRSLSGLSDEYFSIFYLEPIENCLTLLQYYQIKTIQKKLKAVIKALKLRRSLILPPGADAENINKKKDIWTYAIFVSSLMYKIPKILNKNIIYRDINPKETVPTKFCPFTQTLTPNHYYKTLNNVTISNYASPALLPRIFNNLCLTWLYRDIDAFNAALELMTSPNSNTLLGSIIIRSHKNNIKITKENQPKNKKIIQKKEDKNESKNRNLGNEFYLWLKTSIKNDDEILKKYTSNTINGIVILNPDLFQYYAKKNNLDWKIIEHDFMDLESISIEDQNIYFPNQGKRKALIIKEESQ